MIVVAGKKHGDRAKALVAEIREKIVGGADFAEMAQIYSDGSQKTEGGDWGWVDRKVLREEVTDAAFLLEKGELSEAIELDDVFYLMQAVDKRSAHVRPLEEIREEIEKTLIAEEKTRLRVQWIGRLKEKSFVRYF